MLEAMARIPLRSALFICGVAGALWALQEADQARQLRPLQALADRILAQERFGAASIVFAQARLAAIPPSAACDAPRRVVSTLLALRVAESAVEHAEPADVTPALSYLASESRALLACAPAKAYFWLPLFWAETTLSGFDPSRLTMIAMSYRLAPREAWIMAQRARLLAPLMPVLPPSLRGKVVADVTGLIDAGLTDAAVTVLTGRGHGLIPDVAIAVSRMAPSVQRAFRASGERKGLQFDGTALAIDPARPW